MRLNKYEIKAIKSAVNRRFGEDGKVFLFGSRLDDTRKGGDIDVLVEANGTKEELMERKLMAISDIQFKLGERKIDMLTHSPSLAGVSKPPLIIAEAKRTGVEL